MVAEQKRKNCWRCKEEKPLSDFYRCKQSKDGHQSRCKKCDHSIHCEMAKNDRPRWNQYSATWKANRQNRLATAEGTSS